MGSCERLCSTEESGELGDCVVSVQWGGVGLVMMSWMMINGRRGWMWRGESPRLSAFYWWSRAHLCVDLRFGQCTCR